MMMAFLVNMDAYQAHIYFPVNSAKSYRKAIQSNTFEHLFLAGDIIKEAPKQRNKKVAALQFLMLSCQFGCTRHKHI